MVESGEMRYDTLMLEYTFIVLGLVAVFGVTLAVTVGYLQVARQVGWLDRPNGRSSHTVATPRGGGVGFVLTGAVWLLICTSLHYLTTHQLFAILPGWLGLAVLGFCDDRFSLPASLRFLAQILIVAFSLYALGGFPDLITRTYSLHLGWWGSAMALFLGLWSINLFNFMDGTDGIAGVEAVFVLGIAATLLYLSGGQGLAIACFGISAALIAFLVLNWPSAKLFMGDVGSCPLGFLIFIMMLISQKATGFNPLIWFILYGVFLFDASVTLTRRLINGEKWYHAHKSHAYQRLHQSGWSHLKVLFAVIIVNILLAGLAIVVWQQPHWQGASVFIALLLLIRSYLWVEKKVPFAKHRVSDATISKA